jgi:N-acetylmuramoyl-L-alanine amidase
MIEPIYKKHHKGALNELKTKAQLMLDELFFRKKNIDIDREILITHTREEIEESLTTEDDDLQNVDAYVETLPIATDVKELVDYISAQVIKRKLKYLIIHCTATGTSATANSILRYWQEKRGWKNPGYHILFHHKEGFTVMADFDRVCNGVAGQNSVSIQLSYIGGIDKNGKAMDNRSESQKILLETAIIELKKKLPHLIIKGHNQFSNKACPSFNTDIVYKHL